MVESLSVVAVVVVRVVWCAVFALKKQHFLATTLYKLHPLWNGSLQVHTYRGLSLGVKPIVIERSTYLIMVSRSLFHLRSVSK